MCKRILVGLSEADTEEWQLATKHLRKAPGDQYLQTDLPATEYETSGRRSQPQKRATEEEVQAIVKDYEAGMSTKKLAAEYRYARSTITSILKREGVEIKTPKPTSATQLMAMTQLRSEGIH